ncbi:MAG TPA: hypothetical protein VEA36_01370 [Candidatus Paceibacterota bacterium]|nr:hypothetical protein [Candidatus Paceibacterota bacterium]
MWKGLVLLIIFVIGSVVLAIYAQDKITELPPVSEIPQTATVALAPVDVPLVVEGTIVFDDAPARDVQPFVLYGEPRADGTAAVKTKRLVFDAQTVCMVGDVPCVFSAGGGYPVSPGDHVRVAGIAEADVIYVRSIQILA